MLTRKLPFWNENSQKLSKMIVKDKVEFPYFLSLPAIDVMTKMLTKESEERISINALIQHPFVAEEYQFLQNNMDLSESASSTIFPKLGLSPNMMNLRCFKSTYSVTNQNVNGNYRRRISVNSLLKRPQIALFHTPNMSSRNEIKKWSYTQETLLPN